MKYYKWKALSCTSFGSFFSVLSGSTLLIALPEIMKDLQAGFTIMMWILMGYMLALTILVPSIGRIADMYGRKNLYVLGFFIFTLGSFLAGFSASGFQLFCFRMIQAVGGSFLLANSAAIITDAFPKNKLGQALGLNGVMIGIASILGPILGGFLVQMMGWRSIFFVNVPVGIFGTIWAWIQLKELSNLPKEQKFDFWGTIFFMIGMLALLLGLSFGGFLGWSHSLVLILFACSVCFLGLFVWVENFLEHPMMDMRLLKTKILGFAYASSFINGVARGAVTFLFIFYFQVIQGLDAFKVGVMLTPFAAAMMIASPVSGYLADRYGARTLSSLGLLVSALGLLGLTRIESDVSTFFLLTWMGVMGFGSGMFFSPNNRSIMGAVPAEKRGIAAGTNTMVSNAGMVVSLGISMAVLSSSIGTETLKNLVIGTQVGSSGISKTLFLESLKTVFTLSFVLSLFAAFLSFLRGKEWE